MFFKLENPFDPVIERTSFEEFVESYRSLLTR